MEMNAETAGRARELLAREFGIKSAFARPDQLAELTGLSCSAVRTQARAGAFPIPHRRVGKSMLFKVEDVVAWYCAPGDKPAAARTADPQADRVAIERGELVATRTHLTRVRTPSISPNEAQRLKREVLQRMADRRAMPDPG